MKQINRNYILLANLFIKELLNMRHVSTCTSLDNYLHQLLIFINPAAYILSQPNSTFYIENKSTLTICVRQMLPEDCYFFSDFYSAQNKLIESRSYKCDKMWLKFLKTELNVTKINGNKYHCDVKCPELFELIISILDSLEYNFDEYVKMETELRALSEIIGSLPTEQNTITVKIHSLTKKINDTSCVSNETIDEHLNELKKLTHRLSEITESTFRFKQLKTILIKENITKVKNIKIFKDLVKNTEDYQKIVASKIIQPTAPVDNHFFSTSTSNTIDIVENKSVSTIPIACAITYGTINMLNDETTIPTNEFTTIVI